MQLYEAWDKPEQAKRWRQKLGQAGPAEKGPKK
jgi:hypothetical protein